VGIEGIDTDTNIDSHIDTYSYTGSDMETGTILSTLHCSIIRCKSIALNTSLGLHDPLQNSPIGHSHAFNRNYFFIKHIGAYCNTPL